MIINLGKINKQGKDVLLQNKENGCIECISHTKDTCGYTRIRYNGKHERLFRVLYQIKNGNIPKGLVLRHTCDNPSCCNVAHLVLGTQKDNVQDMIERGRSKSKNPKPSVRGCKNGNNILNENQVKEIYLSKCGYRKLSKQYGVSSITIMLIKKQKMWKWLTDTLN